MTEQPTPRHGHLQSCRDRAANDERHTYCQCHCHDEQPTPRTEGSRDLNFIRECVALNPGGYTSEFRFLLDTVNRLEAVAQARTETLAPAGGDSISYWQARALAAEQARTEALDDCDEVRRLLRYLWTATGRSGDDPVSSLFDADDPIVADIERLAAEETP